VDVKNGGVIVVPTVTDGTTPPSRS
jgi:hypothetical protein